LMFKSLWIHPIVVVATASLLLYGCGSRSIPARPTLTRSPAPVPDFSLTVSPDPGSMQAGATQQFQVLATPLNDFNGQVDVNVGGLPSGVTAPANVMMTAGVHGTIAFTAAANAPGGSTSVSFTGTSGTISHTVSVSLNVATPPPVPGSGFDFSLSASPGAVTLQGGGSAQFSISVSDLHGFNTPVSATLTGLPHGVNALPSTLSLVSGTPQTVTLTAASSASPGDSVITLSGSANGLSRTAALPLTLLIQPSLAIHVYPATFTLAPGLSQTLSISATDSNALAKTVGVTLQNLPPGIQASPATLSLSPGTKQQLVFTASPAFTMNGTASLQVSVDDVSQTQRLIFNILPASTSLVTSGLMAYFPMGEGSGAAVNDASGNGYTGTFGGSGNTWTAAGVSFDSQGWIDLPAALNKAQTIQIWADLAQPHPSGGEAFIGTTGGTGDLLGWLLGNQQFVLQNQGGFGAISATPFSGSATLTVTEGNSGQNTSDAYWINGTQAYVAAPTGSRSGDFSLTGHFQLAAFAGTHGLTGKIGPVAFYNRPLTADEIAQNAAFFNALEQSRGVQTQEGDQSAQNQFIAMGDSITFGMGASHPYCYYLNQPSFNVQCLGYPGATTSLGVLQAPQFANYYDTQAKQNIFFIWYVTNDAAASETPAQILQNLAQTCAEVKAVYPGWKVLIGTMMSRVIVPESQRYAINDAIRQQASTICDGYIDVAEDPILGANQAYADGYFVDETHPNDQGQQEISGILTRYIDSVAGTTPAAPALQSNPAYAMTAADNFAVASIAGDGTWSLPECIGLTGKIYTIANQGAGTLSLTGIHSESITGSATIDPNSTGAFEVNLLSNATGGCSWVRKSNRPN
jgi:lysophospholipase L1-like esterase